uniref:Helitron helicase-like domain-containing protein n=1 Tax=Amphimedon queenslandica TaxID=400682 RepID=A0A1X7TYG9_AMPQE
MRGATHYHILLWIENAPVVGINRLEEVCSFIQDRITCHIPDSNTSADLNFLVKKSKYKSAAITATEILKSARPMYLDADMIFVDQYEIVFASMMLKIA